VLIIVAGSLLLVVLASVGYVVYVQWRHGCFDPPTYDTEAPKLPEMPDKPRVLVFSKTNSFRHIEGIPAAHAMFDDFAKELGWYVFHTENAAIHNPDQLGKFDLIVWNNVSGDVLTEEQRKAFKSNVEGGAQVLCIHATGGDPSYGWEWQPKELIRAQFVGHPLLPQFQNAVVDIEDHDHPAMKHLPDHWKFRDEWYSYSASPRARVHVLATLNEDSYRPVTFGLIGSLRMGDHPIIWYHDVGRGRVFYSALGHCAEAYTDKNYRELLKQTCLWLLNRDS